MAFTSTNPVVIGNKTKKSDYDTVFDNTVFLQSNVLGLSSDADVTIKPVFDPAAGLFTSVDTSNLTYGGGTDATDGGYVVCYGVNDTPSGEVRIYSVSSAATQVYTSIFATDSGGDTELLRAGRIGGVDSRVAVNGQLQTIASTGNLVLQSGHALTSGANLTLENDNSGGDVSLRTGTSNSIVFRDASGNANFEFDPSGNRRLAFGSVASPGTGDIYTTTLTVTDGTDSITLTPGSATDTSLFSSTSKRNKLASASTEVVGLPVGADTLTLAAGDIWVEGNDLHYVDSGGTERTLTGV